MAEYTDGYWWNDGLRLHYRDYAGGSDGRPPILCLPGLTRNVRDYEGLADWLAPDWRVIAVSFRGRGESAYSRNPTSYAPLIYVLDVQALLRELQLDRFVAIGTSLGGLVTMLMAEAEKARIAGVVLNDVGPEIEAAGIARIRGYVGKGGAWPTWLHAARALAETHRHAYPDYRIEDWLLMAKRLYRLSPNGRVVIDYDTRIAEPMKTAGDQPSVNLWPVLGALRDRPVLILRGELSDVLSSRTAERMTSLLPQAELATIPRVGHAPSFDEPDALAAIDRMLETVLDRTDKAARRERGRTRRAEALHRPGPR